jgi:hypothetical protein
MPETANQKPISNEVNNYFHEILNTEKKFAQFRQNPEIASQIKQQQEEFFAQCNPLIHEECQQNEGLFPAEYFKMQIALEQIQNNPSQRENYPALKYLTTAQIEEIKTHIGKQLEKEQEFRNFIAERISPIDITAIQELAEGFDIKEKLLELGADPDNEIIKKLENSPKMLAIINRIMGLGILTNAIKIPSLQDTLRNIIWEILLRAKEKATTLPPSDQET